MDLSVTTVSVAQTTTQPPLPDVCNEVDTDFLAERFWLCVVVGLTVSAISVVENVFIFVLFLTSRQHRNSYNLYLMLLSFFDVFMGISYILLMSVAVLVNYTASYTLKMMWATYMVPMLAISHLAMTTSSFLITFAAVERYAITVAHRSVELLQANRRILVVIAFAIALITKGSMFYEVTITLNHNCTGGVQEFQTVPGPLLQYEWFRNYFRFYFRTITTIFAPFFILLYLNFRLVARLIQPSREKNGQMLDVQHVKQKKARIFAATRSLVTLVGTYLLSNLLSVFVSFWEYVDIVSLYSNYISFYVLSVDAVSLLTIVSCALRLPIYVTFQPLFRKEAGQFLGRLCGCKRGKLLRNGSMLERDAYSATQTLIATPPAEQQVAV